MKLRLSNGHSFAVVFSAASSAEFRRSLRRAGLEYFAHEGRHVPAELQVTTDSGEWLSANYPKSNAPHHVRFGQLDSADWADAARSNSQGTWFEYAMDSLAQDISK
jgi:hypothetical protein